MGTDTYFGKVRGSRPGKGTKLVWKGTLSALEGQTRTRRRLASREKGAIPFFVAFMRKRKYNSGG